LRPFVSLGEAMFDLWKDELTEAEEEALIEKAALEIERRKLQAPALMFLESHKPLAFLTSQASITFAPFIAPFLGFDFVNNYSRLFAKRENVDRLLDRIEKGRADAAQVEDSPC
jgi:hypothetical protein